MRSKGRYLTGLFRGGLDLSIMEGAVDRVRPKLMTVATTIIGLLPVMLAGVDETGSQVMKRIAAPMVGGLITSTVLTLLIIPAVYGVVMQIKEGRKLRKELAESKKMG